MKTLFRAACIGMVAFHLGGCVLGRFAKAEPGIDDRESATPPLLAAFAGQPPVTDAEGWMRRRAALLAAFEASVYGPIPLGITARQIVRRVVDPDYAGGSARLEEIIVALSDAPDAPRFALAVAIPGWASRERPVPLILAQNFCSNRQSMNTADLTWIRSEAKDICDLSGLMVLLRPVFNTLFTFPVARMLARGYAVASYWPGDIVPDSEEGTAQALADLAPFATPGTAAEGALAVWAQSFSWAFDILAEHPDLDATRIAYYGHSRHGKAALLGGALNSRVGAVIAHQSGTGGSALSRDLSGETIAQVTDSYPHWFGARFATYHEQEEELPVDQHHLLALLAPTPLLIGNAWRDMWSGPNESFRAAASASEAYRLLGGTGMTQKNLADPDQSGDVFFHIRPGIHSITKTDWTAFLAFLDRVLDGGPPGGSGD